MQRFVLSPIKRFELCALEIIGDNWLSMLMRVTKLMLLVVTPIMLILSLLPLNAVNLGSVVALFLMCVVITSLCSKEYKVEMFESSEGDKFARVTTKRTSFAVFYQAKSVVFNVNHLLVKVKKEKAGVSVILEDDANQMRLARASVDRFHQVLEGAKRLTGMFEVKSM